MRSRQWAQFVGKCIVAFNHLERAPVTVEDVVGVTPPPQGLARKPVGVPQQHVQQKQPEQHEYPEQADYPKQTSMSESLCMAC